MFRQAVPRRRALLEWAASVDGYVVEDDYDGEYRHDVAPIPPLQTLNPQAVIYVGTGRYLGTTDLTDTTQNTFYAVKDDLGSTTLTNPRGLTSFKKQTITN